MHVMAQEPHLRKADSVEELMQKNNPQEYKALINHERYLAVDKLGTKKRWKWFKGDMLKLKNNYGDTFEGQLMSVKDSMLVLNYYDETQAKLIERVFRFEDIEVIYKLNLNKFRYIPSPLLLLPIALDWIVLGKPPGSQTLGTVAYMAGIEGARVLLFNHKRIGNKLHIRGRKVIKVLQY